MIDLKTKTPGQVGFEAYNKAKGGLTWDGKPIPPWADVGDAVRSGWEASAEAVLTTGMVRTISEPQTIRDWQVAIHEYAIGKGWWDDDIRTFGDMCALFTSEVSEAYEEWRNGHDVTETYFNPEKPDKPEGVPTELADVIIRVLDYCGRVGIDMQAIMVGKHAFNQTRSYPLLPPWGKRV